MESSIWLLPLSIRTEIQWLLPASEDIPFCCWVGNHLCEYARPYQCFQFETFATRHRLDAWLHFQYLGDCCWTFRYPKRPFVFTNRNIESYIFSFKHNFNCMHRFGCFVLISTHLKYFQISLVISSLTSGLLEVCCFQIFEDFLDILLLWISNLICWGWKICSVWFKFF
jgi:hypothetical protein